MINQDEAITYARTVIVLFEIGALTRDDQRAVLAVLASALHVDEHPEFLQQALSAEHNLVAPGHE